MNTIKIGIVGYGNLGRGVELAVRKCPDMELVGVFTRRDPAGIQTASGANVYGLDQAAEFKDKIDVMLLCGGSATDLPEQGPALARDFNIVDSFDTHAKIPEYFAAVDAACREGGTLGVISVGWDPGLFSLQRVYAEAVLPGGNGYTFWGKGVSQGHSDAIRRVQGVKRAVQYTVPVEDAMDRVRRGENPQLSAREKHLRECYVVAEEGADLEGIRREIVTMPNYFDEYDTTVTFVSEEEFAWDHGDMPHGGFVMHSGTTGEGHKQLIEFALKLDSNPEFTSSVLAAYARAVYRMKGEGGTGAKTVFDVPPGYLSPKGMAALRAEML